MTIWNHIPYSEKCGGSYKIMVVIVCMIVLYWVIMMSISPNKHISELDFMNHKLIDTDNYFGKCCSAWPFSHFVLFFILGLLFPDCDIPVIIAGVGWEVIEHFIALSFRKRDLMNAVRKDNQMQYQESWWAGSVQDVVFDIAGFYAGKAAAKMGVNIKINGLN